ADPRPAGRPVETIGGRPVSLAEPSPGRVPGRLLAQLGFGECPGWTEAVGRGSRVLPRLPRPAAQQPQCSPQTGRCAPKNGQGGRGNRLLRKGRRPRSQFCPGAQQSCLCLTRETNPTG